MKKTLLFASALLFAVMACEKSTDDSNEGAGDNNQTEQPGDENQTPGEDDENQTPALTFDNYVLESKVILYDDQWIPSSETITITATGTGKETVDFACTETPYEGSKCIKWVVNPSNKTDRIELSFSPFIDLSSYEAKGYAIEFAVKSNWWIGGNDFCVVLRDSKENADKTEWEYRANAIHEYDENTPKTPETPDGTMAPDQWYRVSIPLDEMWGKNTEINGTEVDWSSKTLKDASSATPSKWLPDLKALGKFAFNRWGGAAHPDGEDVVIYFDDIRICERSFVPNK